MNKPPICPKCGTHLPEDAPAGLCPNCLVRAGFGLAKLLGQAPGDIALTATQQVMGTLRYMAPEQMEGTKATGGEGQTRVPKGTICGGVFCRAIIGAGKLAGFLMTMITNNTNPRLAGLLADIFLLATGGVPSTRTYYESRKKAYHARRNPLVVTLPSGAAVAIHYGLG